MSEPSASSFVTTRSGEVVRLMDQGRDETGDYVLVKYNDGTTARLNPGQLKPLPSSSSGGTP